MNKCLNTSRRNFCFSVGAIGAATLGSAAFANSDGYPARPLKLLVPYAPGGVTDSLARRLAATITEKTGQPAVVDNKPGGAGVIAVQTLIAAPADGYTFALFDPSTVSMNPFLFKKLPYHPEKLQPVCMLARNPIVLVGRLGLSAENLRQLVAYSQQRKDLNYGSSGAGNGVHLAMEMFLRRANLQMVHVPFRGGAPAIQALLGDQVDLVMSDLPSALQYIKAGKIRAYAVTSASRSDFLPDVPSIAESGYQGFEVTNHFGAYLSAAVPVSIAERLGSLLRESMASAPTVSALRQLGVEASPSTLPQFKATIASDTEKYGAIIKSLNLQLD